MNFKRFRPGMRGIAISVAAFATAVALLIVWLGHRYDAQTDRIVAEGQLAQGEFLYRETGSCNSDRRSCDSDRIHVSYRVGGREYRTSMSAPRSGTTEPLFEPELIRVARLGEEKPLQVVYLPSDPSISRLREDLAKSDIAVYGTAGFFLLIGIVFGAVGIFLIPGRRRRQR